MAQCRAWHRAWSHYPEIITWARIKCWMLNPLSYPGAPKELYFLKKISGSHFFYQICKAFLPNWATSILAFHLRSQVFTFRILLSWNCSKERELVSSSSSTHLEAWEQGRSLEQCLQTSTVLQFSFHSQSSCPHWPAFQNQAWHYHTIENKRILNRFSFECVALAVAGLHCWKWP